MDKLPTKLEIDTIVEAIFEVRFDSENDLVSQILPGLLYSEFEGAFNKIVPLPLAHIPKEIKVKDPNLKHQPSQRLIGDEFLISVGDNNVSLNRQKPYCGWVKFKEYANKLLDFLPRTNLITSVNRFSLRYINLIPHENGSDRLNKLKLNLSFGDYDLMDCNLSLRAEIPEGDFINVVNLHADASTQFTGEEEESKGVLFDIDTTCEKEFDNYLEEIKASMDRAHDTLKSVFFNTLQEETIHKLKPTWD